jgi:nucleotide-binding universal stress UspA family protein
MVPVSDPFDSAMAGGEVVRAAVARAAAIAPDLEITGEVRSGAAAASLRRCGSDARLLVLGDRSSRRGGLLDRSLPGRLAGRARCPVVVVKPLPVRACGAPAPRVVVGVDGTTSAAALDLAVSAAAQRGLPVIAVHAWTPDRPADLEGSCGPVELSEAGARAVLDRAVAGCAPCGLRLEPRLVCGDPVTALVRESEGAALVVVGSRGRGTVRATAFGSVSRAVARRVRCPVVVVRRDGARPQFRDPVARAEPGRRQVGDASSG